MKHRDAKGNEKELPPDAEALLKGLDALAGDFEDPDKPFSEETKAALGSLASIMDEAAEEFMNGTVVMDPEVFGRFRKAAVLLKKLPKKDGYRVTKIDLEPHIGPALIRVSLTGILVLNRDLLDDFADIVETADSTEFTPNLEGVVDIDFSFNKLWKRADEGGQSGD